MAMVGGGFLKEASSCTVDEEEDGRPMLIRLIESVWTAPKGPGFTFKHLLDVSNRETSSSGFKAQRMLVVVSDSGRLKKPEPPRSLSLEISVECLGGRECYGWLQRRPVLNNWGKQA